MDYVGQVMSIARNVLYALNLTSTFLFHHPSVGELKYSFEKRFTIIM